MILLSLALTVLLNVLKTLNYFVRKLVLIYCLKIYGNVGKIYQLEQSPLKSLDILARFIGAS